MPTTGCRRVPGPVVLPHTVAVYRRWLQWAKRALLALSTLLAVAVAGFFLWAFVLHDPRKDIDLAAWAGPHSAWHRAMMPGARWATEELCGRRLPCIQAVTSETLTLYRFAERGQAVAAAESFGDDGYLTGWIAVLYEPGGLSPAQRDDFEYGIGCINTWVSEDGRDC